jgi:urea transporter
LKGFNNGEKFRVGLFGYNGCLTGMGISYFSFSHSPQIIGPVVIMNIFSTIFAIAIGKILVQRLELSPFTFINKPILSNVSFPEYTIKDNGARLSVSKIRD